MITHSGGGMMTRKNSQTTFAIVGAFVLITILSYYSWSLTSENRTLKRLVVNTYSKLKDMTSHKGMMEKKNTLLSNRMVEMEEQRNAEKQNAEMEQREKQKCTSELEELKSDCKSHGDKVKQCEDASLLREKNLLSLLSDVKLDNVDSDAEKDIFIAKIKYLKGKLKMVGTDFQSLQDKYTEVEKKKIELDERNMVLDLKLKECKKQKVVYVNKALVNSSDTTKEDKEEEREEIGTEDKTAKVYPKKDKKALRKQAEDAIYKSSLKAGKPGAMSSTELKLVTDAVITVPDSGHTVETKVHVTEGNGKDHEEKLEHPKDGDGRSDGKKSSKKSPSSLKNTISKPKPPRLPLVKQSKKLKKKAKISTEKGSKNGVKTETSPTAKNIQSSPSSDGDTGDKYHVKTTSSKDALKININVESKADDVNAESKEDQNKENAKKKLAKKHDSYNNDVVEKVDVGDKEPADDSGRKEGKGKDKHEEKPSDEKRPKESSSLEKKTDDKILKEELNSDNEVENLAKHGEEKDEVHKKPAAVDQSEDRLNNVVTLPAFKEDNIGMME